MKVINNKKIITMIMGSLLLIIVGGLLIWNLNSANKTQLEEVKLKYENDDSGMFAIMLEEIDAEGNSTYVESSDNMWPSLKYKYNATNSGCLDVNGTSIPDILSYDSKNQKAIVRTKKVAYCYLYFDIDESVYAKVRNDYTDNNGALLLSETESDEYPVYYYNGDITNNNILYANFCWKMVRTTETGGVKLIYNGIPDEAEDGTLTCDNTGEETEIGKSKFSNASFMSSAGYMYNSTYEYSYKNISGTDVVTNSYMVVSNPAFKFYYGDKAVWNEETGEYDLKLSDNTNVVETTIWSTDLIGKYTCRNTTDTSCAIVYYVAGGTGSWMYNYELTNNKNKDDYKIKLAASVTDNEDGTYTLVNPIEVSKADWPTKYSEYKNYYYCGDLISETCSDMYYSSVTNGYQLLGSIVGNDYKYGNSFTYENGVYRLVDTKEFWNWSENYNTLNNNHYTCFNDSGECENLYYIYYTSNITANYIILADGKTIEVALNEMLYAEDVNRIDSTIKAYIDEWYESAILDNMDFVGNLYSDYLEDTIFCNSRTLVDLSMSGWNPNGGSTSNDVIYFNYNALECENKTDQFTLKAEVGGTEGYGNNALDYPIGLLSYKEADLASTTGYIKSGSDYWLMSPLRFDGIYDYARTRVGVITPNNGITFSYFSFGSFGVRPVVSLSNSIQIINGTGEVDDPYQIEISS